MLLLATFLLSLFAISSLPQTHAWTLVWTNPNGVQAVEPGVSNTLGHPCKEIDNPKGAYFEFDGEKQPVTIYLYPTTNCSGTPSGYATYYLAKNASSTILSYEVIDHSVTTTIVSTTSDRPSSSPTTSNSSVSVQPAGASSVPPSSSSGSSLSAGGIAGVVVGAVVGLGLIGAILYLARQRRKQPPPDGSVASPVSPDGGIPPVSQIVQSPLHASEESAPKIMVSGVEKVEVPAYSPKQQPVSELAGDTGTAELSDTRRLNELEASTKSSGV